MAPSLLPGDIVSTDWIPQLDRLHAPARFECWTLALPDGSSAVKRVLGLPGEVVAIVDGDLLVDGRVILKSPRILAAVGCPLADHDPAPVGFDAAAAAWRWTRAASTVLDDAPIPEPQTRMLLPVRDGGVMAIIHVRRLPGSGTCRVRIRIGDRVVPWRLTATGRHTLVAGRLDGHLVAAAWLGAADTPDRWQVAAPWPGNGNDDAPSLAIGIEADDETVALEQATAWRDVLHRPLECGATQWRLGPDQFLVLGDFPPGSSDSRQWGPVAAHRFHHRVTAAQTHWRWRN